MYNVKNEKKTVWDKILKNKKNWFAMEENNQYTDLLDKINFSYRSNQNNEPRQTKEEKERELVKEFQNPDSFPTLEKPKNNTMDV